ncbi:hypothetical protein [Chryseobacterium taichungense]|uniref:hypothetical protein n=1 Tax=Chryseobacterium taichungense TaxID=295069 RepID=UPI0028A97852|nr:hypothetical protein [Chryseobacterium taichungense]
MKKTFLTFITLLMITVSCTNNNGEILETNDYQKKEISTSKAFARSSDYVNLTDSEINEIGDLHNEILGNFVLTFPNTDVDSYFMNYELRELSQEIKNTYENNTNNYITKLDYIEKNLEDKRALEIIKSVLDYNYTDLNDLSTFIAERKEYSKRNFSKLDLDTVLVFLEVYKKSAIFWDANPQYLYSSTNAKIGVRGLVAADGLGAAGAIMQFVIVAAPLAAAGGPVGIGMLVSYVGWGAGLSSAGYLVCAYKNLC